MDSMHDINTCLRFSGSANVLSVVTSSQWKSSPSVTMLRMESQRSPNADLEGVRTIGIDGFASSAVWKKILLHRFPQVSLMAFAESLESGVTAIRTSIENIRLHIEMAYFKKEIGIYGVKSRRRPPPVKRSRDTI